MGNLYWADKNIKYEAHSKEIQPDKGGSGAAVPIEIRGRLDCKTFSQGNEPYAVLSFKDINGDAQFFGTYSADSRLTLAQGTTLGSYVARTETIIHFNERGELSVLNNNGKTDQILAKGLVARYEGGVNQRGEISTKVSYLIGSEKEGYNTPVSIHKDSKGRQIITVDGKNKAFFLQNGALKAITDPKVLKNLTFATNIQGVVIKGLEFTGKKWELGNYYKGNDRVNILTTANGRKIVTVEGKNQAYWVENGRLRAVSNTAILAGALFPSSIEGVDIVGLTFDAKDKTWKFGSYYKGDTKAQVFTAKDGEKYVLLEGKKEAYQVSGTGLKELKDFSKLSLEGVEFNSASNSWEIISLQALQTRSGIFEKGVMAGLTNESNFREQKNGTRVGVFVVNGKTVTAVIGNSINGTRRVSVQIGNDTNISWKVASLDKIEDIFPSNRKKFESNLTSGGAILIGKLNGVLISAKFMNSQWVGIKVKSVSANLVPSVQKQLNESLDKKSGEQVQLKAITDFKIMMNADGSLQLTEVTADSVLRSKNETISAQRKQFLHPETQMGGAEGTASQKVKHKGGEFEISEGENNSSIIKGKVTFALNAEGRLVPLIVSEGNKITAKDQTSSVLIGGALAANMTYELSQGNVKESAGMVGKASDIGKTVLSPFAYLGTRLSIGVNYAIDRNLSFISGGLIQTNWAEESAAKYGFNEIPEDTYMITAVGVPTIPLIVLMGGAAAGLVLTGGLIGATLPAITIPLISIVIPLTWTSTAATALAGILFAGGTMAVTETIYMADSFKQGNIGEGFLHLGVAAISVIPGSAFTGSALIGVGKKIASRFGFGATAALTAKVGEVTLTAGRGAKSFSGAQAVRAAVAARGAGGVPAINLASRTAAAQAVRTAARGGVASSVGAAAADTVTGAASNLASSATSALGKRVIAALSMGFTYGVISVGSAMLTHATEGDTAFKMEYAGQYLNAFLVGFGVGFGFGLISSKVLLQSPMENLAKHNIFAKGNFVKGLGAWGETSISALHGGLNFARLNFYGLGDAMTLIPSYREQMVEKNGKFVGTGHWGWEWKPKILGYEERMGSAISGFQMGAVFGVVGRFQIAAGTGGIFSERIGIGGSISRGLEKFGGEVAGKTLHTAYSLVVFSVTESLINLSIETFIPEGLRSPLHKSSLFLSILLAPTVDAGVGRRVALEQIRGNQKGSADTANKILEANPEQKTKVKVEFSGILGLKRQVDVEVDHSLQREAEGAVVDALSKDVAGNDLEGELLHDRLIDVAETQAGKEIDGYKITDGIKNGAIDKLRNDKNFDPKALNYQPERSYRAEEKERILEAGRLENQAKVNDAQPQSGGARYNPEIRQRADALLEGTGLSREQLTPEFLNKVREGSAVRSATLDINGRSRTLGNDLAKMIEGRIADQELSQIPSGTSRLNELTQAVNRAANGDTVQMGGKTFTVTDALKY